MRRDAPLSWAELEAGTPARPSARIRIDVGMRMSRPPSEAPSRHAGGRDHRGPHQDIRPERQLPPEFLATPAAADDQAEEDAERESPQMRVVVHVHEAGKADQNPDPRVHEDAPDRRTRDER